jgi:hypothetical protein
MIKTLSTPAAEEGFLNLSGSALHPQPAPHLLVEDRMLLLSVRKKARSPLPYPD